MITHTQMTSMIAALRASRKYRQMELPEEMLWDILASLAPNYSSAPALEKAFRQKVHNVIAPYLEDIDYVNEFQKASDLQQRSVSPAQVKTWATELMQKHASTRERLPHLDEFCAYLTPYTDQATLVLDLACALDPLMLPWLHLPPDCKFVAYDVNKPRIDLLNAFFSISWPNATAIQKDILLSPPSDHANCVLLLKEAHRLEKRQPGSSRRLFEQLQADVLIVSLPAEDLSGHHSLTEYHSRLIRDAIGPNPWPVVQSQIGNELIFVIEKAGQHG